ncbi:MAG: hypothetical protein PHT51_00365 [Patescibacteria group bacterium]|nr:hypothetical protein [Patescibacteria group bacterium]MDD4611052.1 hypothetical protein [Patescibacteria group bacterium]
MKKNKIKVGVLGFGEVGKAVAQFYKNPLIGDKGKNEFIVGMDFLHVCIPYSKEFVGEVLKIIRKFHPKYVVIHSTVAVGTTRKIGKEFKNIAHSPIRGVHPNLHKGIKTFVKYVGSDDNKTAQVVSKHFRNLGMKVLACKDSRATELGKLLDTTYYGSCISFHHYAFKLCQKLNLDFDIVMKDFNTTYNEGYKKLGKKNVIRPVLFPPQGKIGGHCVVSNAKILKKQFGDNTVLKCILNVK